MYILSGVLLKQSCHRRYLTLDKNVTLVYASISTQSDWRTPGPQPSHIGVRQDPHPVRLVDVRT